MTSWIFQGNPDYFDIDQYLAANSNILWVVRQHKNDININDDIFIWRAAGKKKAAPGIVAYGKVTEAPTLRLNDVASIKLWTIPQDDKEELRVGIQIQKTCLGKRELVKKKWIESDPVLKGHQIIKVRSGTNFPLKPREAKRLLLLVQQTGKDWSYADSLAGLWAYEKTYNQSVSKRYGSPVSKVAVLTGRAVEGVYNKVMNFRSLDSRDIRKGLSGINHIDKQVWDEYFNLDTKTIDIDRLESDFKIEWEEDTTITVQSKPNYDDFGEAPNDDPEELRRFAVKVRKGQPKFRKNLLRLYDNRCAITGTGPKDVLEAVHILGHAETGINKTENGLLLRADLHDLFDAKLLRINPDTLRVELDSTLKDTGYWKHQGVELRARTDGTEPNRDYLREQS
jgi:predicted restriction endonuclease